MENDLKIINLGGTYGSDIATPFYDGKTQGQSDDERIASLVRGALNRRMIIEYRTKCINQNTDFNAFVASRTTANASFDGVCLKYMLEKGYLPRKLLSDKNEELDEATFVERLGEKNATLLYAEGGSGKSLFLKNLVHTYFKGGRYVFSTTAKDLAAYLEKNQDKEALLQYFIHEIYAYVGYGYQPDLTSIYSLLTLDGNRVLFVIDALDELGDYSGAMARIREATVESHLKTEKNVHFLFTSRNSSDGRSLGTDEVYSLKKFTAEDGQKMAKILLDTFAEKLKEKEGGFAVNKPDLSEKALYSELSKLREDIAGNPLLVTNFVILYLYHVIDGGALPRNEYEIAKESIAFLTRDLESERGVRCDVSERVLASLNDILCHLAYRRAINDRSGTEEILAAFIRDKLFNGDQAEANLEARKLLGYLRSRAIVVGADSVGNVCHAIFRSYLTAHAIYKACYSIKTNAKEEDDIVFKKIECDGETTSAKDILEARKKKFFAKYPDAWVDAEVFLVADLDKSIYDLPEINENDPLTEDKTSYKTLKETLDILYGGLNDKERDAYQLIEKMLDAESLYNIEAIKKILDR